MWLAFFVGLYVFIAILYYIDLHVQPLDGGYFALERIGELKVDGALNKSLIWYISVSKNLEAEASNIAVLAAVFVLPQICSFILSGIFGCGRAPYFVSAATNVAIMFLIKGICVLCSLELAYQVIRIEKFGAGTFNYELTVFVNSFFLLPFAFALAAIYYLPPKGWLDALEKSGPKKIKWLLTRMMRRTKIYETQREKERRGAMIEEGTELLASDRLARATAHLLNSRC